MPTITISGPAQAFAGNPRGSKPITDRRTLLRFHGLVSKESCANIFDHPLLNNLGLSGGRLRFVLDAQAPALRIITAFHVERQLSEVETKRLVEATSVQWSDGCGSGSFENFYGAVCTTALAMAILNGGGSKENIGDYFVDAFPMFAQEEPGSVSPGRHPPIGGLAVFICLYFRGWVRRSRSHSSSSRSAMKPRLSVAAAASFCGCRGFGMLCGGLSGSAEYLPSSYCPDC